VSWSKLVPPPFESLRDGFGLSRGFELRANNPEDAQPLSVDGEGRAAAGRESTSRHRAARGVGVGSGGTVGGGPTVTAMTIAMITIAAIPAAMNAITFCPFT